jgi:hypothetical protein
MRLSGRRLMVPIAAVAAALVPAAAMASGLTLSLGSARLIDRTVVTLPVTVSCSIDPSVANYIFNETLAASVQQPAGRSFATASVMLSGSQTNPIFPCDGSSTTVNLAMVANPGGPPFHRGTAIVTVGESVQAGFEAFPGCGCGQITYSASTNTSPQQVALH